MYDVYFDVTIKTMAIEEPEWHNTTTFRVLYREPPCEVTQDEIDAVAGTDLYLSLSVTRGVTEDQTVSYS